MPGCFLAVLKLILIIMFSDKLNKLNGKSKHVVRNTNVTYSYIESRFGEVLWEKSAKMNHSFISCFWYSEYRISFLFFSELDFRSVELILFMDDAIGKYVH